MNGVLEFTRTLRNVYKGSVSQQKEVIVMNAAPTQKNENR